MKKYKLFLLTWASLFVGIVSVNAQAGRSFNCDFEDESQNKSIWHLSNGVQAPDIPHQWIIGPSVNNGGSNSLYLTTDSGQTAAYARTTAYTIAYADVTLTAGAYKLSFDWKGVGAENGQDGLYVCWVADRDATWGDSILLNSNKNSNILSSDIQVAFVNDLSFPLRGAGGWQQAVGSFETDGKHHRLAFIWVSSDSETPLQPGACIDNIYIMDNTACNMPTKLSVTPEGRKAHLAWTGSADKYEVRVYFYSENRWITQIVEGATEADIDGMAEGVADFYVYAICGEEDDVRSIPCVKNNEFFYFPDNHCVPYLSLDSTNCYVAASQVSGANWLPSMQWDRKCVNHGYANASSRHTIHFLMNEYDPRTATDDGYQLRTVPDGAIASVRLGNWRPGYEAERVEFTYHVNARTSPVLMLNYAVVLQEPNPNCTPNPGFLMRILDKDGNLISDCASADFDYKAAAASSDPTWHESHPSGGTVMWKDWTPVGVNLQEWDDQDLTIQLTTYDCGAGGHYGYAYFTLDCSDGKLTGMTCGEINTVFTAPSGFAYRWYNRYDHPEQTLSTDSTYVVDPSDTCHYGVDLMFVQSPECSFSLTASAQPFMPSAQGKYTWRPNSCRHFVHFSNQSVIKEINQITGVVSYTNNPVDYVEWIFGDGQKSNEENPVHEYPADGGVFNGCLVAHLATCTDTLRMTLDLPALGTQYSTLPVQQCAGAAYTYSYDLEGIRHDTVMENSGEYPFLLRSWAGCDSVVTVQLTMVDTVRTMLDTLIMRGDTCKVSSQTFTETGIYDIALLSAMGCDSIVTLRLYVHDDLQVDADTFYVACAGDPSFDILYRFTQGTTDTYSLTLAHPSFVGIDHALLTATDRQEILLPDSSLLKPGRYTGRMTFYDSISGDVDIPYVLEIRYAASVITQRWNDVLAIRNAEYNGGYEFDSVQWYVAGQPIEEATEFNYYTGGAPLRFGEEYYALLQRRDGVKLFTCSFIPTKVDESVTNLPSLVRPGDPIKIQGGGKAYWYDLLGHLYSTQFYDDSMVTAPEEAGSYILLLKSTDSVQPRHMIVRP